MVGSHRRHGVLSGQPLLNHLVCQGSKAHLTWMSPTAQPAGENEVRDHSAKVLNPHLEPTARPGGHSHFFCCSRMFSLHSARS